MTQADRDNQTQAAAVSDDPGHPAEDNGPGAAAENRKVTGPVGTEDVHNYIGHRLRDAFNDIASQPVPDRFLELMRALDKS